MCFNNDNYFNWTSHMIWVLKHMLINSVQKLCGTVFSQFLLLYVVLGPTSLGESYSCRPPLISPAGSVPVLASGKPLISWKKLRNTPAD